MSLILNTSSRLFYKDVLCTDCNNQLQLYNCVTISGFSTDKDDVEVIGCEDGKTIGMISGPHSSNIELTFSSYMDSSGYSKLRQLYDAKCLTDFVVATGKCKRMDDPYDAESLVFLMDSFVTSYSVTEHNVLSSGEAGLVTEEITVLVGNYQYYYLTEIARQIYTPDTDITSIETVGYRECQDCDCSSMEIFGLTHSTTTTLSILYSADMGRSWSTLDSFIPALAATDSVKYQHIYSDAEFVYIFIGDTLYMYDINAIRLGTVTVTVTGAPLTIVFPTEIIDMYSNDGTIWAIGDAQLYKFNTALKSFTTIDTPFSNLISWTNIHGIGDNIVISTFGDAFQTNIGSGVDNLQRVTYGGFFRNFLSVAVVSKNKLLFGTNSGSIVTVERKNNALFVECSETVLDPNTGDPVFEPNTGIIEIAFFNSLFGIATSTTGAVFMTVDSGTTWKKMFEIPTIVGTAGYNNVGFEIVSLPIATNNIEFLILSSQVNPAFEISPTNISNVLKFGKRR